MKEPDKRAVRQAVKLLGDQFVLGTTIESALQRAKALEAKGYRFSYDMLGEAARSEQDAERYFQRYMTAIDAVGAAAGPMTATNADAIFVRPSICRAVWRRITRGLGLSFMDLLLPRLS